MEKRTRAPGGGRKPLPATARRSKGSAVTLRLSPMEEAQLRTWAPPDVGLGGFLRSFLLGYVAGLRASALETAREAVRRLDAGEEVEVTSDDGTSPEMAIRWIRAAVDRGDARGLPPSTVRLRAGDWTGVLPGMAALLLPDPVADDY